MRLSKLFLVTGLLVSLNGPIADAQAPERPSLDFGLAQINLGMTVDQVTRTLAESGRHIQFLSDKVTAVVRRDNEPIPQGDEGQITFSDGRVTYAAFQFPSTQNAIELAQELAGAVEGAKGKTCTLHNYSSRGTGGGTSQTILDCQSEMIVLITVEVLGETERYSHVEVEIGSFSKSAAPPR